MHHRIDHKPSASGMMPEFQQSWNHFAPNSVGGNEEGFTCLFYAANSFRDAKVIRRLVKTVTAVPELRKVRFLLS